VVCVLEHQVEDVKGAAHGHEVAEGALHLRNEGLDHVAGAVCRGARQVKGELGGLFLDELRGFLASARDGLPPATSSTTQPSMWSKPEKMT
jgi:hypothetical protein